MKKVFLTLSLLSSFAASAVIQVNTSLNYDGKKESEEQIWYVGDHIKRSCGDVQIDGTIREINGDVVTVHFKIESNGKLLSEEDVRIAWGQEGTVRCPAGNAELSIILTDLYDQHPQAKKQTEQA